MSKTHGYGFISTSDEDNQNILDRLNTRVKPTDLFQYGLIPEFTGRLPIIATFQDLTRPMLVRDHDRAAQLHLQSVPGDFQKRRRRARDRAQSVRADRGDRIRIQDRRAQPPRHFRGDDHADPVCRPRSARMSGRSRSHRFSRAVFPERAVDPLVRCSGPAPATGTIFDSQAKDETIWHKPLHRRQLRSRAHRHVARRPQHVQLSAHAHRAERQAGRRRADLGHELGRRLGVPVELVPVSESRRARGRRRRSASGTWPSSAPNRSARTRSTSPRPMWRSKRRTSFRPARRSSPSRKSTGKASASRCRTRSAYELYLTRNTQARELVREKGADNAFKRFVTTSSTRSRACARGSSPTTRTFRARASSTAASPPFSRRRARRKAAARGRAVSARIHRGRQGERARREDDREQQRARAHGSRRGEVRQKREHRSWFETAPDANGVEQTGHREERVWRPTAPLLVAHAQRSQRDCFDCASQ